MYLQPEFSNDVEEIHNNPQQLYLQIKLWSTKSLRIFLSWKQTRVYKKLNAEKFVNSNKIWIRGNKHIKVTILSQMFHRNEDSLKKTH